MRKSPSSPHRGGIYGLGGFRGIQVQGNFQAAALTTLGVFGRTCFRFAGAVLPQEPQSALSMGVTGNKEPEC